MEHHPALCKPADSCRGAGTVPGSRKKTILNATGLFAKTGAWGLTSSLPPQLRGCLTSNLSCRCVKFSFHQQLLGIKSREVQKSASRVRAVPQQSPRCFPLHQLESSGSSSVHLSVPRLPDLAQSVQSKPEETPTFPLGMQAASVELG